MFTPLSWTFEQIAGNIFVGWQSVLLVEETTDLPQVTDKLDNIMLYWVHLTMSGIRTHNISGLIFYIQKVWLVMLFII
jgi:hypothetical protein